MFYYIRETFRRRYLRGDVVFRPDKNRICPVCGRYLDIPPYEDDVYNIIDLIEGNHLSDILWVPVDFFCVNERAKELFLNENLTGYTLKNISLNKDRRPAADKKKLNLSDIGVYYRVIISRNPSVMPDMNVSEIEFQDDRCNTCMTGPYRRIKPNEKVVIDASTWNGNDFFYLTHYGRRLFCTQKAVDVINKNKIKYTDFEIIEHTGEISRPVR